MQALLGSGLPTVPGTEGLLTTVDSLLGTAGLDTATLQNLLSTARGAAAAAPAGAGAQALGAIVTTLGGLPARHRDRYGARRDGPGHGTRRHGTRRHRPAPRAGAGTAGTTPSTAYRAAIASVIVAKNRREREGPPRLPGDRTGAVRRGAQGRPRGREGVHHGVVTLLRGASRTVMVKLTGPTAKRLKAKGGSLRISAATSSSSLAAVSKTVRVERARR